MDRSRPDYNLNGNQQKNRSSKKKEIKEERGTLHTVGCMYIENVRSTEVFLEVRRGTDGRNYYCRQCVPLPVRADPIWRSRTPQPEYDRRDYQHVAPRVAGRSRTKPTNCRPKGDPDLPHSLVVSRPNSSLRIREQALPTSEPESDCIPCTLCSRAESVRSKAYLA